MPKKQEAEVKENIPVAPKPKLPVSKAKPPVETPQVHTHQMLDSFYNYHRPYDHSTIKLVPCPLQTNETLCKMNLSSDYRANNHSPLRIKQSLEYH